MAEKLVYVVEDELSQREGLAWMLKDSGFNVREFNTVDAALEHMGWRENSQNLSQNLPDLIVTDNNTNSRYRGLDLLAAAKRAGVPRVMAAGGPTDAQVIAAGGKETRYFKKPYLPHKLIDEAQKMLAPQQHGIS